MMFSKIKKEIKIHGALGYCVYVLERLLLRTTDKMSIQYVYLYKIPVIQNREINLPNSIKKIYRVVILTNDDEMLHSFPLLPEMISFRFRQNSVCFVVIKNEEPIGFLWIVQGTYHEDQMLLDICLGSESAWDYGLWIHEKHRLSPAVITLWEAAFNYLETKGVKWIYSRITTINNTSLNVHARLGGCIIGKLLFIKIYNREICWDSRKNKISIHKESNRKNIYL